MAISVSKIADYPVGPGVRKLIYDLTFTGVTGGVINTGLQNILHADYSPGTSDDHGIVYKNYKDAGTTKAQGQVYIDSVSSSDIGSLEITGV